jgi:4-methyl-5(b-hydroxyethyl)-thiazole monophosphate biosynthesis
VVVNYPKPIFLRRISMKVIVPIAEGFEEIEAITIVDILRRADIDVTTATLSKNPVKGSHGIPVKADRIIKELNMVDFNCIVLPGGMPGSENLKMNDTVLSYIKHIYSKGGYIAAICAAPIVLGQAGVLYGKNVTCFPGYEGELIDANYIEKPVVVDGSVITGRGAGCAIPFALEIVGTIRGNDIREEIKNNLQVYWM